jgi:UDP-N-acetyl-D-glucosamine 4,6-dehydratase
VAGRVFMVTGAGGTIGSQLARDLLVYGARMVVLVENSEYALYRVFDQSQPLVPRLISYGAYEVAHLLEAYNVDCIIHAGAYKHVPLVELNPIAGIQNNVFEFKKLLTMAESMRVPELVVISSDKAVEPSNVMGATKSIVERLAFNCTVPKVSIVRFGNVLGSSGSVLDLFEHQLRQGLPLTITHEKVERYFMSVPEACGLVLQSMSVPGKVKVLDMGKPIPILELAKRFLELRERPDHPCVITGLRDGEKMSEDLCPSGSRLVPTSLPRVLEDGSDLPEVDLSRLQAACLNFDFLEVRQSLKDLGIGYVPACGVVDPLYISTLAKSIGNMDDCFTPPKASR